MNLYPYRVEIELYFVEFPAFAICSCFVVAMTISWSTLKIPDLDSHPRSRTVNVPRTSEELAVKTRQNAFETLCPIQK